MRKLPARIGVWSPTVILSARRHQMLSHFKLQLKDEESKCIHVCKQSNSSSCVCMLSKWFCGAQTNSNGVSPFRAQWVILFLHPLIPFQAQFLCYIPSTPTLTGMTCPHPSDLKSPIRTLPARLNLYLPFDLSPGLPLTMTILSLTHSSWRIENSSLHRISLQVFQT